MLRLPFLRSIAAIVLTIGFAATAVPARAAGTETLVLVNRTEYEVTVHFRTRTGTGEHTLPIRAGQTVSVDYEGGFQLGGDVQEPGMPHVEALEIRLTPERVQTVSIAQRGKEFVFE